MLCSRVKKIGHFTRQRLVPGVYGRFGEIASVPLDRKAIDIKLRIGDPNFNGTRFFQQFGK
jgi:hypothetical protein